MKETNDEMYLRSFAIFSKLFLDLLMFCHGEEYEGADKSVSDGLPRYFSFTSDLKIYLLNLFGATEVFFRVFGPRFGASACLLFNIMDLLGSFVDTNEPGGQELC